MMKIAIFGAGGFGREVAWLIEEINKVKKSYEIIGFIDEQVSLIGQNINGYLVLGGLDFLIDNSDIGMVIAVGNPVTRIEILKKLKKFKNSYPNLIHPSVLKGRMIDMGIGNVICAGTILTENIKIGNFCQFNLNTTIGHDAKLGDFTTSACSVDFAGYSNLGIGVYCGNKSTVLPSICIGDFSVIGAGAVVNKNIPDRVVAVGVPARILKHTHLNDDLKIDIENFKR
ncbi:MAG: acetyltransferase [bacterium]